MRKQYQFFLALSGILPQLEVLKLFAVCRKPVLAPFIQQRSIYATTELEIAAINRFTEIPLLKVL